MPVYEYRCTRCNHLFEEFHQVGGSPGPCPVCGGPGRRVFTSVGLIFKGSGFHTTDYRKSPSGDGASKEPSADRTAESTAKTTPGSTTPAPGTSSTPPAKAD
jgi:putative FmdB family regulatory protein